MVALLSLLARVLHNVSSALILILFGGAAWIGFRQLHRTQFASASSMFLGRKFRRIIDAETRTVDLEASLTEAISIEDCWAHLCKVSSDFGFHEVRMSLGGRQFEAASSGPVKPRWQLRIPLPDSQWVNFYRDSDSNVNPLVLNAFVEAVERGLEARSAPLPADLNRMPPGTEHYQTRAAAAGELKRGAE